MGKNKILMFERIPTPKKKECSGCFFSKGPSVVHCAIQGTLWLEKFKCFEKNRNYIWQAASNGK